MSKTKILFINTEVMPYLPESRMSSHGRRLPQELLEAGHEVRIFMPRFGPINERRNQLHEVIRLSGMNMIIDDTDHPLIIKVASLQMARMQVYFIDNEDYFSKTKLEDPALLGPDFPDNDERTIFFARGVLETVKKLRWNPDVIHIHGWIGVLIALYVKVLYKEEPCFRNSRIVISLYEEEFKSLFRDDFFSRLRTKSMEGFDTEGINMPINYTELMKFGVKYADGIIINASNVNEEVVAYARELGKPILDYPGEGVPYYDACNDFYEEVYGEEEH